MPARFITDEEGIKSPGPRRPALHPDSRALTLGLLVPFVLLSSCERPGLTTLRPGLWPPPSAVDFGTLPVLAEKQLDVPLLNVGRAALSVSQAQLAADEGAFRVVSSPTEVASGETGLLRVAFAAPRETAFTNTLSFDTDDPASPHVEVALAGVGFTAAVLGLSPATLDFGRVGECASALEELTLRSTGNAELVIDDLSFTAGTSPTFSFVGSAKTPVVVKPGELIQLTLRASPAQHASGTLEGGLHLTTNDPLRRSVVVPLTASVDSAPLAVIAPLANGSPGQLVTLDGTGSTDPHDGAPLTYQWTLRSKPPTSTTVIDASTSARSSMRLDATVPGAYEVQLDVTSQRGVRGCVPARATVVAAPAQKLMVEMFWDNAATDLDLHVLRTPSSPLSVLPDDCFFQNRAPDWGLPEGGDDPLLVRDALRGYGPEVFGYLNPVEGTSRAVVVFSSEHLAPAPASTATVRVYVFGVLKAELTRKLEKQGEVWPAVDIDWPSGDVRALP